MAVLLEVVRAEVTITACLAHNSHGVMREISISLGVDPLSVNGLVVEAHLQFLCNARVCVVDTPSGFCQFQRHPCRGGKPGNYEFASGWLTSIIVAQRTL